MTFHKEGVTSMAITLLVIVAANALVHYYAADHLVLTWIVYVLSFLLFIIILQFFRSPSRHIIPNDETILCPADGKIVIIEEVEEPEYFKGKRLQVSVFMSPINVHVNRSPINGKVNFFKYHPGKYLVAWHPKSSLLNERTTLVLGHASGKEVLVRQIAGALARRIVWYVKEGDTIAQGDQFGFIKFGSRVDLYLPVGTQIDVQIGQVVTGGVTVLGKL
jgi:phosphatidylserine decarboxylase